MKTAFAAVKAEWAVKLPFQAFSHALPRLTWSQPSLRNRGKDVTEKAPGFIASPERSCSDNIEKQNIGMNTQFLSAVNHDIRTPLNGIMGIATILHMARNSPEKQQELTNALQESAAGLLTIINDFMDCLRADGGDLELEDIPFNLEESLRQLLKTLKPRAEDKDIQLTLNYASSASRACQGDPQRVERIFANLIEGIIHASDKVQDIALHVSSGPPDEKTIIAEFYIHCGDPTAQAALNILLEKAHDPDQRWNTTDRLLATGRKIAEALEGQVSLRHETLQKSVVTVRLPILAGTVLPAGGAPGAENIQAGHPQRNILLVEDYAPNILVAATLLEEFGYTFDVAQNGPDAIKCFQANNYDMVLMDVQMAGMDGFETTRRIRLLEQESRQRPTPVIAMTAHVMDRESCAQYGMNDCMSKPFRPDELLQMVERFVKIGRTVSV